MNFTAHLTRHSILGCLLLCMPWMCARGVGSMIVRFDQEEYVVSGPNETFDVQILLDSDASTPEVDPPTTDLFSFGAEVQFDSLKASVTGVNQVITVAPLDHFGFDDGAFQEVGVGVAGAKGNVSLVNDPPVGYGDSLLTTMTITNLAAAPDAYVIELAPFITLGPNEELFVDIDGTVLDPDITFGSARVRVVPEPIGLAAFFLVPFFFIQTARMPIRSRSAC